ncbi:MAG: translation initiation factor IF-3 [Phycisphaerales bacterium]|jgi:translation initiation factor IF-3
MRQTGPVVRTRLNHMIRLSPVRLIGPDGEQVGVTETPEAIRMAQEAGLDLVEISPDSRPPVCKIMDYGKYKYELSKRESKNKKAGKTTEQKEIRLGRSIKIDPHDVQIRVDQSRRFLVAGHKVGITQRFRGREMAHKELGLERLERICVDLSDVAKVEMSPRWMGRQASILLAPDKVKIEAYKKRMAEEGKALKEEDLAALEAQVAAQNALDDLEDDDAPKRPKQKGPKDDRAKNPVDDEVADLLGDA